MQSTVNKIIFLNEEPSCNGFTSKKTKDNAEWWLGKQWIQKMWIHGWSNRKDIMVMTLELTFETLFQSRRRNKGKGILEGKVKDKRTHVFKEHDME